MSQNLSRDRRLACSEYAARLTQPQLKRLRLRAYFDRRQQRFVAPSEPTFRRVLQQVDPVALEQAFSAWVQASAPADEPLAIDGKTLKGARRGDGRQTHLLAALFPRQGSVLAQRAVEAKHNEIPALRELLDPLSIKGRVVTADALHTQRETARFLVEEKGAHYLFTVKDNQKTLANDLKAQASLRSRERFWDIRIPKIDSIFDNSLVPRQSWSPGVPPQHRKLVAATHRSPI